MLYLLLGIHFVCDMISQNRNIKITQSEQTDMLIRHLTVHFFAVWLIFSWIGYPIQGFQLASVITLSHWIIDVGVVKLYKRFIINTIALQHRGYIKHSENDSFHNFLLIGQALHVFCIIIAYNWIFVWPK